KHAAAERIVPPAPARATHSPSDEAWRALRDRERFLSAKPRRTRSSRVDVAHAQTNAPLTIDFQHFHADHVAFLELVADALHALIGNLRDVHEAVLAGQDRD